MRVVSTPGRMSGVVGAREVVARTKGRRHGPITRLASPSDLGEMLKPFVFLDYFELDAASGFGFNAHPHSGIATHTTCLDGALDYGDSTGKSGSMAVGNLEWMQAAGGVWHWGQPSPGTPSRGYPALGRVTTRDRAGAGDQRPHRRRPRRGRWPGPGHSSATTAPSAALCRRSCR